MGYTTEFSGSIKLSRPLTMKEAKTILEWAEEPSTIDFGNKTKVNGYLQWVPSKTLDSIGWDGNEKFYYYEEWMKFVCKWLAELGISASGELQWVGEDSRDIGVLSVKDNSVFAIPNERSAIVFTPISLSDLAAIALEQAAKE